MPGMPAGGAIGAVPRIPAADGTVAAGPTGTQEPPDTGPSVLAAGIGGTHDDGTESPPIAPAPPRFAAAPAAPEAALAAPLAAPLAALEAPFMASAPNFCRPSTPLTPRQTAQMLFDCRFEPVTSWVMSWLDRL